jgi:hypothetical protein
MPFKKPDGRWNIDISGLRLNPKTVYSIGTVSMSVAASGFTLMQEAP